MNTPLQPQSLKQLAKWLANIMNAYKTRFSSEKCDVCGERSSGLLTTLNEVPVFFTCSLCAPHSWNEVGEKAKDGWLSGNSRIDVDSK